MYQHNINTTFFDKAIKYVLPIEKEIQKEISKIIENRESKLDALFPNKTSKIPQKIKTQYSFTKQ